MEILTEVGRRPNQGAGFLFLIFFTPFWQHIIIQQIVNMPK